MHGIKLITAAISGFFLLVVSAVQFYSELYIMAAAVMSLPFISYVIGRFVVRRLHFDRVAPEQAREGEMINVKLHLYGKSKLLGPIEMEDQLDEWIEGDWEF